MEKVKDFLVVAGCTVMSIFAILFYVVMEWLSKFDIEKEKNK